jgi:orotate phosphoribosyltransferase
MNKIELLRQLREINVIKYGDFILKSGAHSTIYIDLRSLISYPKILRSVSELMWKKMQSLSYDLICGVPYTALPIATCVSIEHNISMLLARKEAKTYGTKKQIEGAFSTNQTCVILEDVVTTGGSVIETAQKLEEEGLIVQDVITVIERESVARDNLRAKKYELHSIFTLSEIL